MVAQANFLPINEISAYYPKWTIKARITNKTPLRTFRKGTGEGKVFSCDLVDVEGGEIRATFFNESATKFFDFIQVKKCFTFTKGNVKVANRQYNSCNHRYELTFDQGAVICPAEDDNDIGVMSNFVFTDLRAVAEKPLPLRVDLCGVVVSAQPLTSITTRDGRQLVKREIVLADDTASSMDVTFWGESAKIADKHFEGQPIVGLKKVFVKEWNNGRSGSVLEPEGVVFEPEGKVAERVRQWWSAGGKSQNLGALSGTGTSGFSRNARPCDLAEMRRAVENITDQAEHFSVVSRLALLQTSKKGEEVPLYYRACGELQEGKSYRCNRRVDSSGYCASCNRIAGTINTRLTVRCRYADCQDSAWLTTFHEPAEKVLGMAAEHVQIMGDAGKDNRQQLEMQFKQRYFVEPMQLTIRSKPGMYNNEARVDTCCVEAREVNRQEHGRCLLQEVRQMLSA